MASGWCRADEPLDADWHVPSEAPAIIGAKGAEGTFHTQAPWTNMGGVPSTAVRNPEAYTGFPLGPSTTTQSTCQVRNARRTVANWDGVPDGSLNPVERALRIPRAEFLDP
jgi:hypothetical protein